MKAEDLLSRLDRGEIPVVTLLHGEERWFAQRAAEVVKGAFLGDGDGEFATVEGKKGEKDLHGTPLPPVIDDLRTVPMFGGRRVFLYRAYTLEADDLAALLSFAKAKSSYSRLVLHLDSLPQGAAPKLTKAGAAVGEARKLFDSPWAGKPAWNTPLNQWAVARARELGLKLDLRTAHVLTGIIGNELGNILAALRKLTVESDGRGPVGEDEIRKVTGGGREFDAFAFGDAIYARDAARALRICRNAFSEGISDRKGRRSQNASGVAARLLWSVNYRLDQIHRGAAMLADGRSEGEVQKAIGGNTPAAIRGLEYAKTFELATLRQHHVWLLEGEGELRRINGLEQHVLEVLIPRLTGALNG